MSITLEDIFEDIIMNVDDDSEPPVVFIKTDAEGWDCEVDYLFLLCTCMNLILSLKMGIRIYPPPLFLK